MGQTTGKISNCYYIGKITANSTYSNAISSDKYNRGTLENCYYLESCGLSTTRAVGKQQSSLQAVMCVIFSKAARIILFGDRSLSSEGSMPVLTSDEELRFIG